MDIWTVCLRLLLCLFELFEIKNITLVCRVFFSFFKLIFFILNLISFFSCMCVESALWLKKKNRTEKNRKRFVILRSYNEEIKYDSKYFNTFTLGRHLDFTRRIGLNFEERCFFLFVFYFYIHKQVYSNFNVLKYSNTNLLIIMMIILIFLKLTINPSSKNGLEPYSECPPDQCSATEHFALQWATNIFYFTLTKIMKREKMILISQ